MLSDAACVVLVARCASGADRPPDGGRLSAPGLLLLRTEPVGSDRTFSSDQVRVERARLTQGDRDGAEKIPLLQQQFVDRSRVDDKLLKLQQLCTNQRKLILTCCRWKFFFFGYS